MCEEFFGEMCLEKEMDINLPKGLLIGNNLKTSKK
jgi:hypothetical protein